MSAENTMLDAEAESVRDLQRTIRNELDKRRKQLKAIHYDSGIGYSTLQTYFPNPESDQKPAALPVAALRLLCGAIDLDLLSLMLPDGFQIVRVPESVDHDEIAEACRAYLEAKDKAHHPDSPAQRDISDCEDAALRAKVVPLRGVAA